MYLKAFPEIATSISTESQCHGSLKEVLSDIDDFHYSFMPSLVSIISAIHTSLFTSIIEHYRATETAVRMLSPVAMVHFTSHFCKFWITSVDSGLSLFSIIKKPRKVNPDSISSLRTLSNILLSKFFKILVASVITLYPSLVYCSRT